MEGGGGVNARRLKFCGNALSWCKIELLEIGKKHSFHKITKHYTNFIVWVTIREESKDEGMKDE